EKRRKENIIIAKRFLVPQAWVRGDQAEALAKGFSAAARSLTNVLVPARCPSRPSGSEFNLGSLTCQSLVSAAAAIRSIAWFAASALRPIVRAKVVKSLL